MRGRGTASVISPSSRVDAVGCDAWAGGAISRGLELSSQAAAAELAAWRILAVTALSSGM